MAINPLRRRRAKYGALVLATIAPLGQPVGAEVIRDTIVVTAPRLVGRNASRGSIELITVARYVSYQGLDLRTTAGVAELNKRIAAAAYEQCQELETNYPIGRPEAAECTRTAIRDAEYQVQAAIRETAGS